MDTSILAEKIRDYRKYTGLNMTIFAERIGISYKVLSRLERGGEIKGESREICIAALNDRLIKPGEIQCWPDGRRRKTPLPNTTPASLELAPPLESEVTLLLATANRYDQLVYSWSREKGRLEAGRVIRTLIKQLVDGLSLPISQVRIQTHCMLIGLVQGLMLRDGIIDITEVFEDQNTIYYVPPKPVVGRVYDTCE